MVALHSEGDSTFAQLCLMEAWSDSRWLDARGAESRIDRSPEGVTEEDQFSRPLDAPVFGPSSPADFPAQRPRPICMGGGLRAVPQIGGRSMTRTTRRMEPSRVSIARIHGWRIAPHR
jgi:hypothetical protein